MLPTDVGRAAFIPKNLGFRSPCLDPVLERLAFEQLNFLRGLDTVPSFLREGPEGLELVCVPPSCMGNQRR